MKILSIDTASDVCGISILDDKKSLCNLDENTGRTHSENLMPMIKNAFKNTNLSLENIDLIVCDIGPGSFTGIRIGISTAKAFMDSLNIPCSTVSSLESLCYNVKLEYNDNYSGTVCSILDCKNSNCYFALYQFNNGFCECIIEPSSDNIDKALEIIQNKTDKNINIVFVGDGIYTYMDIIKKCFSNSVFLDEKYNILNSYSLALAGLEHKPYTNSLDVLPLYLKKPQAQRQLEDQLQLRKDK